MLARALCHVDNAYWIPHVLLHGRVARTHKTSQTAFRGFGGPQGMLVVEDVLGRCAPLLGIDPVDLRRRNFYVDGPVHAVRPAGAAPRRARRRVGPGARAPGRSRAGSAEIADVQRHATRTPSAALALTPVKFGISFNFTAFNQAGALVHVYKDGSVLINHGGTEMGQGLHTKMLQVAATALGVPLERVRLAPTRTDKVPNTSATAASSGADLNGGAVKHACEQVLARLAESTPAAGCPGTSWSARPTSAACSSGPPASTGPRASTGTPPACSGHPFKYFAYGVAASRGRGRRLHRGLPHPPGRHRARRGRQPLPARRPRPDRGRLRAGRGLADAGGPALGRVRRPGPRPAHDAVRQHLQAAELRRAARRSCTSPSSSTPTRTVSSTAPRRSASHP